MLLMEMIGHATKYEVIVIVRFVERFAACVWKSDLEFDQPSLFQLVYPFWV